MYCTELLLAIYSKILPINFKIIQASLIMGKHIKILYQDID